MAVLPVRDLRIQLNTFSIKRRNTIKSKAAAEAIFHCCVQRTGSRWLLRVLSDPIIFSGSGLAQFPFPPLVSRTKLSDGKRVFPRVPQGAILGPLYYSFSDFQSIEKPMGYRAAFVIRDPRDIVVSHYFSTRNSHRLNPTICERRIELLSLSEKEGFQKTIDWLAEEGLFDSIESWLEAEVLAGPNSSVRVFKYEDLTGPGQTKGLNELLEHYGIAVSDEDFERLCSKYSLQQMRKGNDQALVENSHYRSGRSGDWEKHLDKELLFQLCHHLKFRTLEAYGIGE